MVKEDTEEVVAHRRMQTLRDLGSRRTSNLTEAETISSACQELAGSPADVPFTLVYLYDDDGSDRPAGGQHRLRTGPPGRAGTARDDRSGRRAGVAGDHR